MMTSGKEGPRVTSLRMRKRSVITLMKNEITLTTKGRETESQVLEASGVNSRIDTVKLGTLDFV